jgi:hypothetical protein
VPGEIDRPRGEYRAQDGEVLAQPADRPLDADPERGFFQIPRAEAETEGEPAMAGSMGGLRLARDHERMARVDRDHRGADVQARNRGADHGRQRQRIEIETLPEPGAVDAAPLEEAGPFDHIVDGIGGGGTGSQGDSDRCAECHAGANTPAGGTYSVSLTPNGNRDKDRGYRYRDRR